MLFQHVSFDKGEKETGETQKIYSLIWFLFKEEHKNRVKQEEYDTGKYSTRISQNIGYREVIREV